MMRRHAPWPVRGLAAAFFAAAAAPAASEETAPGVAPPPARSEPVPLQPEPEMTGPRITFIDVDWEAARSAVAALDQHVLPDAAAEPKHAGAFGVLNAATDKILPNVAASAVPVLLPFDTVSFLRDQREHAQGNGNDDNKAGDDIKYFGDFHAPALFYPGPSGYDAAFSLQPQDLPGLDLAFSRPVSVQISASTAIYELDGAAVDRGSPVQALDGAFPGIRRVLLENRVRYTFLRFGVPYVVSIGCFDGPKGSRRLSCREADRIAVRFIEALNIVGGSPQAPPSKAAAVERPDKTSPDFTFYAPGDILPGTGMREQSGRADATVYAAIRFPIAHAPAYINSQSFMNWGNCDLTGRVALGGHGKDAEYRCRVNTLPLLHDEAKNYAYPWRDNFCEHRHYEVAQCPAGLGHQGEDIRPSSCKLRNEGADRCEPYQDDVVAVREGAVLRNAGDEALYLVVDAPGEHLRFRYLHMNPHMLDAAGLVSGRKLAEGDLLGAVGDYGRFEGGTTYHLHFDMQVPTRQGWLFVNPYMTLVAAYEHLIGARGRALRDTPPLEAAAPGTGDAASGPASAVATNPAAPESESVPERRHRGREAAAEHCTMRFIKGHRRHVCRNDVTEARGHGRHAHTARSAERHASLRGDRTRHHAANLHARHERGRGRHGRA